MDVNKAKLIVFLEKNHLYLSAFQEKIVFGRANEISYSSYLEFDINELELLYVHIRNWISYLTNFSDNTVLTDTIKDTNNIKYYYRGKSEKLANESILKSIELNIDLLGNTDSFVLDLPLIERILRVLPKVFFSAMNINCLEKIFLYESTYKEKKFLISLKENFNDFVSYFKLSPIKLPQNREFEYYQLFIINFKKIKILSEINLLFENDDNL